MKIKSGKQCAAIIEPGELVIDKWDGQRCIETNPSMLAICEKCEQYWCLSFGHWAQHSEEEYPR